MYSFYRNESTLSQIQTALIFVYSFPFTHSFTAIYECRFLRHTLCNLLIRTFELIEEHQH